MKALISVTDKTGIIELSQALIEVGIEIISTGGTAKTLQQAQLSTIEVSDFTGFPEILGGRVKTLHPKIFGGILACRDNAQHQAEAEKNSIASIDWVIVNLYPFEKIYMENKLPKSEMIEFIDIGGVSLLRAAAKNFTDVVVVCDPQDYSILIKELKENKTISMKTKKMLAGKVFSHTAHYDSMISKFFQRNDFLYSPSEKSSPNSVLENTFPDQLTIGLRKISDLRYGENPQQKASLYTESGEREWGIVHAEKLQGKELSFNNYLDLDHAWQIVNSLKANAENQQGSACVIIKHTNPCGSAIAQSSNEAFLLALSADPLSAFGGIIAFSQPLDEDTAQSISQSFFECIIAPDYTVTALEIFKKKPNLRILRQKTALTLPYEFDIKKISGGLLLQEPDFISDRYQQSEELVVTKENNNLTQEQRKIVSKRSPSPEELYALEFAWKICKFVKSNAIVLTRGTISQGVGAGQMSRIDSLKIAIQKMKESKTHQAKYPTIFNPIQNTLSQIAKMPLVMASDAFFPFRDCVDEAVKAGTSAIIVPGGSLRDQESIDAANEQNISMIFTGTRHFKH